MKPSSNIRSKETPFSRISLSISQAIIPARFRTHLLSHMDIRSLLLSGILPFLLFNMIATPGFSSPIVVAGVQGTIDPATSKYIVMTLEKAERMDAELLLIELDTPGGLMESMREITAEILNSRIPVVVYVSPPGARAASAGVFISAAAHVIAMAPGTHLGAAHPVGLGPSQMDSVMSGKVESDAAAQMRALANQRSRNVEWYERSVRKSVSATAEEALELGVIDLIATNRDELLRKIDGMEVELAGDIKKVIASSGRELVEIPMGLRDKLLHYLANPNLAYIFLILGFYGLYFELSNPGSIFPGVTGVILLLLGIFAMQMMPVNYVGIVLIAFGMFLFLIELKIPSHGLLTIGGIVSLVLGSLMLFDTTEAFYRVSWVVLIPVVAVTVAFFVFAIGMGLRAQRKQPATGREGLVGAVAEVVEPLTPHGRVFLQGELWFASADEDIPAGSNVRIIAVTGMKLLVEPV